MRIDPNKYYPTVEEINEGFKKPLEIDEDWITKKALEKQEKENLINIRKSKIFR